MEMLTTEIVDDGTKQGRTGRRLMAPERIEELVAGYRESGLTRAEFARRAGVKYATFAGWVNARRAQRRRAEPAASVVRFAQVQMPAGICPGELSVTLPDGVVVRGGDAAAVAALVRALRS